MATLEEFSLSMEWLHTQYRTVAYGTNPISSCIRRVEPCDALQISIGSLLLTLSLTLSLSLTTYGMYSRMPQWMDGRMHARLLAPLNSLTPW